MCQPAALTFRANVDFHDARDCMFTDDKSSIESTAAKRSCSEVLATCKTLQSRVPLIRVIALNHPALAPGCLFIGLVSDVPGNPSDSASCCPLRLNPADCQPFNVEFSYTKHPEIAQARGVLFFGATAETIVIHPKPRAEERL